jgi:hypothetical protein
MSKTKQPIESVPIDFSKGILIESLDSRLRGNEGVIGHPGLNHHAT